MRERPTSHCLAVRRLASTAPNTVNGCELLVQRRMEVVMSSSLVINAAGRETRVALIENGHIAEFYLERKKDQGVVGNIYKGRVTRVLPGMQAAFVDIGLERAAFLYVGDVLFDPEISRQQFELTEGEHDEDVQEVPDVAEASARAEERAIEPGSAEVPDARADQESSLSGEWQSNAPAPVGSPVDEAAPDVARQDHASDGEPAGEIPAEEARDEAERETSSGAPDKPNDREESGSPATTPPAIRATRSANGNESRREGGRRHEARKTTRIEDLLKVGQEVIVQVSKDPIGGKGARVTSHISIPGRHLVFMPTVDHVGISRRIGSDKERRRLREIVDRMRPSGTGFIVRTVAERVPQPKLEADIRFLIEVWNETVRKSQGVGSVGLLHADLDIILRATRDLFANDVEQLIIDDQDEFARVQSFVISQDPELKERVLLHSEDEPIFDAYGIEEEIRRATARRVWLKSGGYIVIDQAEALTAIDVNSGRFVGRKDLEDTITKLNVEAAKEIVYQLRLRNIGGIIICDFIDMEKQQNRDKVFKALQESLGRDKAKTNVLRISELGLIEMTRKRVRESIGRVLHDECGYCGGHGFVKSASTVAYDIFRELRRSAPAYKDPTLVVQAQTEVADLLNGAERGELRHLMDRFNKSIQIRPRQDYHREQYDIYARPVSGVEIKVAGVEVNHNPDTYAGARQVAQSEQRNEAPARANKDRRRGRRGGTGGGNNRSKGERRPEAAVREEIPPPPISEP